MYIEIIASSDAVERVVQGKRHTKLLVRVDAESRPLLLTSHGDSVEDYDDSPGLYEAHLQVGVKGGIHLMPHPRND